VNDRHIHLVEALRRALLDSKGQRDDATRRAAMAGTLDGDLGTLVKKIRDDASAITDEDIATLTRAGHSDDALLEVIVCAAFGAGDLRLAAAKRAIEGK
jgi:hypothetical protein